MIEIAVTPDVLQYAKIAAEDLGILRNSISSGRGNVAGFIGDMVASQYLGATMFHTYDYDLIFDNVRIDMKTKLTTVAPLSDYECSVADYNTKQDCDWYGFARVSTDLSTAWLLGYMPKDVFYQSARFLKKGQIDGSNNFKVKADCYNVYIKDLLSFESLKCRSLTSSQ